jgi:uncharacterized protein (DUF1810 family)
VDDRFDLQRFVTAQDSVYDAALGELRAGRKRSHWMWFVFPQIAGLGSSPTAQHYAIGSLEEAHAYLAHPVLGRRLVECVEAVNAVRGRSAGDIFGYPDELKFRSSLTLFMLAAAPDAKAPFRSALDKYFGGEGDAFTLDKLGGGAT